MFTLQNIFAEMTFVILLAISISILLIFKQQVLFKMSKFQ